MKLTPLNEIKIAGKLINTTKLVGDQYRLIKVQTKTTQSYTEIEVLVLDKYLEKLSINNFLFINLEGYFVSPSRVMAKSFKIFNTTGDVLFESSNDYKKE